MPRIIDGQGFLMTSRPPWFSPTSCPSTVTIAASIPKKGLVHDPGTHVVAPGSGVSMCPPVSVCHHVSTMGALPEPILSLYHIHASGLMGSPTEPRILIEETSCFWTC